MIVHFVIVLTITTLILLYLKSFINRDIFSIYKNESTVSSESVVNQQPGDEVDNGLVKNTDIQPIDFSKIELTEFNLDKPKQRKSLSGAGCYVITT